MEAKNMLVTCNECRGQARIKIVDTDKVMYIDHTPIIACRFRPDLKWGFECTCGNDTRLAPEEAPNAYSLIASADPGLVDRIVSAVTAKPEAKFKLEIA